MTGKKSQYVTNAKTKTARKSPHTRTRSANNGSSTHLLPSQDRGGIRQATAIGLAPSKPAYFNIDDQVARTLGDSKFAAKRQEYMITIANAFFAAVTHEA